MFKLYHAGSSVCSQKVRVGLAEMDIDYENVELNLQKGDQFDPAYTKLNPNAVVPTLVDDGLVVIESSLILEYVDREHNGSKLMPSGRELEAEARNWLLRCIAIHAAINSLSFSTAYRTKILEGSAPDQIEQMLSRMPDPVMRAKRKDLIENGLQSAYVYQALIHLRGVFRDMSAVLDKRDWVSGPEFGISDIALVAYVDRLDRLGFNGLWATRYPAAGQWLQEMQARQSYLVGIDAFISDSAAAEQRNVGSRHWPELKEIWVGLH